MKKDFIIKQEEINIYGNDIRAVIRAFADRIAEITNQDNLNDKNNLEYLLNEIKFILEYEL